MLLLLISGQCKSTILCCRANTIDFRQREYTTATPGTSKGRSSVATHALKKKSSSANVQLHWDCWVRLPGWRERFESDHAKRWLMICNYCTDAKSKFDRKEKGRLTQTTNRRRHQTVTDQHPLLIEDRHSSHKWWHQSADDEECENRRRQTTKRDGRKITDKWRLETNYQGNAIIFEFSARTITI